MQQLTKIDKRFLSKLSRISTLRKTVSQYSLGTLDTLTERFVHTLKVREAMGVMPCVKQIGMLASAFLNYLYMAYGGLENDTPPARKPSWCSTVAPTASVRRWSSGVSSVRTVRELGKPVIAINYNCDTVSTDYDENDRLHFEGLSLERVLAITPRA
ncbi:hypothetical protein PF010_g27669 [Phytophthora fragariae]|uniref:Carbamoyl-phosphate synthetase large subunit oligomerisation domain-containing protein n=1 Tax=Phytophthora fragariae TaxID=53985 RepID=A0A6A3HC88_9STRA|nr:hypothetical protein PF011_g27930 [Phytophthora fragariae]KAE9066932.1 hypothetical protein PF010_g27669 [Phytophthora fragariae]KAE9174823.1 hypothetical protein PF002_g28943 [Phytophthora fragariae]KAE9269685.1 hypothetical protein PF001_g29117 [Phytophthora fragariae]